MATTLSEEHERELKKIFDDYDQNGSGDIDIDELRDIAEDLGEPLSEVELRYLAKEFDSDRRRIKLPSQLQARKLFLACTACGFITNVWPFAHPTNANPSSLSALGSANNLHVSMAKRERAAPIITDDGFTINGCAFHVASKYKPIDAIGQGSYGVVCSVKNSETDEKLAIKKITPMAGDEWDATHTLREIRLMRCLGAHENLISRRDLILSLNQIISLKDLSMCQDKDELYMMMELADTDLHRLIQSSCPLTEGHIRVIMFQILSGVKAMHDNGVLHRDLKPGNLLLNKDCELKITDFGLARKIPKSHRQSNDDGSPTDCDPTNGPADSVISPMTEYVVTRWYRPPELMLAPNGCYDGSVDMWSVGCILGELISRKPMFPGTDFMDQLTRVFKVIPIPDKDQRGYFIEKDALKFLSSLPPAPPNALEKFCKNGGPHAYDLMRKLLCFNPKERISADEALAHPFFDGVKDEWGEIAPLKLNHSLDFAFETQALPLTTLRQYICEEVLAFQGRYGDELRSKRKEQLATAKEAQPQHGNANSKEAQQAPQAGSSTTHNSSASSLILENDFAPGKGFTIKGCEFNVAPQYKPLQVLGEGSYGIVCAATDTITKKNVAIKKITPMAGDEWDAKHTLREIRLMRYFGQHPNIASLQNLSTCTEKDELYIMMDLVDTDLHRLIQSKTKLEEAHIAAIMYQLICGAKTLHENAVLHRDLKPGNILVSKNCDVKITDFGLSRYIPQECSAAPPTSSSTSSSHQQASTTEKGKQFMTEYVVTRWYRPPEIMLAPNGNYNDAVDMWSIGCIFGELLNRRPLFPGTDFIDQLTKVFSVLQVPPADKRGYEIEGDALKFLESLPPCSPSALTKTFRKASPEAVSLLRRLLCINPERRITAKQALAHPYFKNIRQQLGEPPEFIVDKAFDFEFDQQDCPLSHLKQLIQAEVKLLQKDKLAPPSSGAPPVATSISNKHGLTSKTSQQSNEALPNTNPNVHNQQQTNHNAPIAGSVDELSDEEDGLDKDEDSLLVESLDSKEQQPQRTITKQVTTSTAAVDNISSKQQHEHDQKPECEDGEPTPTSDSGSDYSSNHQQRNTSMKQQQAPTTIDSEDEEDQQQVERSGMIPAVTQRTQTSRSSSTTTRSKIERPQSAHASRRNGTTTATSSRYRSARDEDERPMSGRSSNNNHSNNIGGSIESGERWVQPRATATASFSSRIHHPTASSTIHSDRKTKPSTTISSSRSTGAITSRTTMSSSSSASLSSNQTASNTASGHKDIGSHEKSDASRRPERVSLTGTTTARSSKSSSTTPTSSGKDAGANDSLPEGWIKKTHSKSGREYYYDTLNKVSSWKHPSKMLENIFGTTRVPSSRSSTAANKSTTPSSASPSNNSNALTPHATSSGRRSSLSGASATSAALPKDWVRRTDPKTGRLYYVNLTTNKTFARLPSSVSASMLHHGKETNSNSSSTTGTTASKKAGTTTPSSTETAKRKVTVPQSPQFSQMSWQRKCVPATDD